MSGLVTGIVSLGLTATTTGISMAQKNKAQKKQSDAEFAANKAMQEARKRLDVNFAEARSISKDPYTMAIEASLAQGADAVQASRETQRGAAQVGRIQAAQNQMAEGQRVAYGQELQARENAILDEESRLRDINTQLDLGEVAGAQEAAARFEDEARQAGQDVVAGVTSMAQQGMAMAPLYSKTGNVRQNAKLQKSFMAANEGATAANYRTALETANPVDFAGVGAMNQMEFNALIGGMDSGFMRTQSGLFD